MKVAFKRAASVGALCLGLAVAASAVAQDRPAGPGGPPNKEARAAERQKMFEMFKQQRQQRLHDLLQIKPDQEGAFRTFLAAVEPQHKPGERGTGDRGPGQRGPGGPGQGPGAAKAPMTTPERLDHMSQRIAQMQARIAATRAFYGALSPDQRKAFDAIGPMMGHGGGGHHHGRHGFGGPGGPGGPGGRHGFEGPPPPAR